MHFRFVLRAALILFVVAPFSAHAAEKVWTNPTSGTFNDPANWTGGVPGAGDTATFNASGTYGVVFDNFLFPLNTVIENQGLSIANPGSSLQFNSGVGGPYTYHMTGAGENDIDIMAGTVNLGIAGGPLHLMADDDLTVRNSATLNVNFGSEVNVHQLHLGVPYLGSTGRIFVDGTNGTSRLNVVGDAVIGGSSGGGSLTFRDDAKGDLSIGGTIRVAEEHNGFSYGGLTVSTSADIRVGNMLVGTGITASGDIAVSGGGTIEHVGTSYLIVGNGATNTSSPSAEVNISGGTYTLGTGKTTVQGGGEISVSGGQFRTSGDVEVAAVGGTGSFDAEFRLLSNSVFAQSGDTDLTIGSFSGGPSMFILSGTSATTGTGLLTVNKTGTLDLNSGSFNARGDVLVDGGLIDHGSNVTFTVASGRTMTLQSGGRFNTNGTYSAPASSTVNISGGGSRLDAGGGIGISNGALVQLSAGGTMGSFGGLTIGSQTSGTLRASGIGSGFTVGSSLWGTGTGIAQVSLSDGAIGTVNGQLRVSFNTFNGGGAVIDIDSGARLSANDVYLKDDGGPDPSTFATLTIRGSGSTLSTKDSGDLVLGTFGSSTGSATVNVLDGGALTLGTNGVTQLNASATINIDGGIVDLKTLNQNGGKINFTSGSLSYTGSLNIASGGLLGQNITLGATKRLTVNGTSTVAANSLVLVNDQGQFTTGMLDNGGEVRLDGVSALVTAATVSNNGMIRGNGRITAEVQNSTVGEIRVGASQQLQVNGLLGNGGDIVTIGAIGAPAEFNVSGPATNAASTGLIVGREAILDFKSGLVNAGALALNLGTNDVFGDVNNTGTGSIVVTGGSHATFYDDVVQNGTMTVSKVGSTTSVAVFLGDFSGDGGASGGGDIFFEGDLQPGNSPAAVTYSNNVYFGAGTVLGIEIGGLAPGAGHDKVTVNGGLNLDGTLQVSLVDGFIPSAGDSYEILDWTTLSGSFDQLVLPSLGSLAWDTSRLYTNGVLAIAQGTAIPGDTNLDNVVDAADYVAWRKTNSLNSTGYTDFHSNFGSSGGVGGTSNGTVPEPAAIVFAIAAVLSAIVIRRR